MKYIKLFEQFVNEGGWSTVKTQNTILNPLAIKKTVEIVRNIESLFNKHLESIDLPAIDFGRPVGSGTWWQDDLDNNPDKIYGDVDLLVTYPTLKLHGGDIKKNEAASVRVYNDELMTWLEQTTPAGVDPQETRNISNPNSVRLVVVIDIDGEKGWVQVDMVVTHAEYKDWALSRLTPIRNIKGFVLGNLYSAFGEVLDLSVQLKGVRAKIKDGILTPYSQQKGAEEILISSNIRTFLMDIAKFFNDQSSNTSFNPRSGLVAWRMDMDNPTIEQLFNGIKELALELDKLEEFGGSIKYKSSNEFLKAVVARYEQKMMANYTASKFDKAESDQAKEMIKKIREMITSHIKIVKSMI